MSSSAVVCSSMNAICVKRLRARAHRRRERLLELVEVDAAGAVVSNGAPASTARVWCAFASAFIASDRAG